MYLKNLFCGVEDTTKAPILNIFGHMINIFIYRCQGVEICGSLRKPCNRNTFAPVGRYSRHNRNVQT